jgi:uncharacterized membrane protein
MGQVIETHNRTLARAISYRILATVITAIWTGLSSAIVIHVALTVVHYIHERLWLKVKWGINGRISSEEENGVK